jgi:hypothetical protein
VDTRSLGEIGIDVDGGDVPPRADHLGEDRCVVADAAADVQDAVTGAEVQRIAPAGERTRLAVVQASCRVDRHQHVGVQVSRVGPTRVSRQNEHPGEHLAIDREHGERLIRLGGGSRLRVPLGRAPRWAPGERGGARLRTCCQVAPPVARSRHYSTVRGNRAPREWEG